MTDPDVFREGVGQLLGEVQRIKSQGDYEAAKALFEAYGIHFDPDLRDQVLQRVALVNLPSYSAFVMPKLEAVRGENGEIVDVTISYPLDLTQQMLEYSGKRIEEPYLSHPGGAPDRRASSWISRISWSSRSASVLVRSNSRDRVVSALFDLAPLNRVVAGREFGPQSVDSIL